MCPCCSLVTAILTCPAGVTATVATHRVTTISMAAVTALATIQPVSAVLTTIKHFKGAHRSRWDKTRRWVKKDSDLLDRTRRSAPPSTRGNTCRRRPWGHMQLRWHMSMCDYSPDPTYRWSRGWSSPYPASLEVEEAQENMKRVL